MAGANAPAIFFGRPAFGCEAMKRYTGLFGRCLPRV